MSTKDLDKEWGRISDNPQNMIVSDSLRGIIDFEDEKDITKPVSMISIVLSFGDKKMHFELVFMSKKESSYEVSFLCSKPDAFFLMTNDSLDDVRVTSNVSNAEKVFDFKAYEYSLEVGSDQLRDSSVSGDTCLCSLIINV